MNDGRSDDEVLDQLAKLAGSQRVPPMSADDARRMAQHAIVAAAGHRARARRRETVVAALGVAAAIGLAFGAGRMLAPSDRSAELPGDEPRVVSPGVIELPTGDRLTTLPTTRMAILADDGRERITRLDEGEVLFDVAPGGGRFAVLTPDAQIEVRGTVFAVRVDGMRTRVHVFEGRVEVLREGASTLLGEGETLDTRSTETWRPTLTEIGRAAREQRLRGDRPTPPRALDPTVDAELRARADSRAPTETTSAPERARSSAPRIEDARRALAAGELERVLTLAARSSGRGEWAMLEGDALRALRRDGEAADAYDRAASSSSPSPATQAGYLAARLRLERLDDAAGALRSLDASRADAAHSPVEDPSLALRVRALIAAQRSDEAREVARQHLRRFPGSPSSSWMARLADGETPAPR